MQFSLLRTTDFKSASTVLTSFYYALPSSIYQRFSRHSRLRLAWYEHVSPSTSPHLCISTCSLEALKPELLLLEAEFVSLKKVGS